MFWKEARQRKIDWLITWTIDLLLVSRWRVRAWVWRRVWRTSWTGTAGSSTQTNSQYGTEKVEVQPRPPPRTRCNTPPPSGIVIQPVHINGSSTHNFGDYSVVDFSWHGTDEQVWFIILYSLCIVTLRSPARWPELRRSPTSTSGSGRTASSSVNIISFIYCICKRMNMNLHYFIK